MCCSTATMSLVLLPVEVLETILEFLNEHSLSKEHQINQSICKPAHGMFIYQARLITLVYHSESSARLGNALPRVKTIPPSRQIPSLPSTLLCFPHCRLVHRFRFARFSRQTRRCPREDGPIDLRYHHLRNSTASP